MSLATSLEALEVHSDKRITVVTEQKKIEDMLVNLKKAAAIFFVPSLVTPLYVDPEIVEYDEGEKIYKLKEGEEKSFPDGLVLENVRKDPAQFSTVLGRAITVNNMLKAGIPITVLHVASFRKKAGKVDEYVNDAQVRKVKEQYPQLLRFQVIDDAIYQTYKTQVCAATYSYFDESGVLQQVGVDASQANTTAPAPADWGIRVAESAAAKIDTLNAFLKEQALPNLIEMLQDPTQAQAKVAQTAASAPAPLAFSS